VVFFLLAKLCSWQEKKAKQLFFDYDSALMFVFYPDLISAVGGKQELGTEMVMLKTIFIIKALNIFLLLHYRV